MPEDASTPPRDALPRPLASTSRGISRGRMGSGPNMAAEEVEVDVEGDVVPAAAQPG